ncbi:MAG: LytTR family DNA-binding domain-containing protein [Erysipelotrichaceae bacterium]
MYKIAICDDQPIFISTISSLAQDYFDSKNIPYKIETYTCTSDLLSHFKSGLYDLIIMDIEFNHSTLNGIDAAEKINYLDCNCKIIFISSFSKYYIDIYKAEHLFFVVKDNLKENLLLALNTVYDKYIAKTINSTITLKVGSNNVTLPTTNVLYFENILRKVNIHLLNEDYVCYLTFNQIKQSLPSEDFFQCHRSYIINLNYVYKVDKNEITLLDNTIIPIGGTYKKQLLSCLFGKKITIE